MLTVRLVGILKVTKLLNGGSTYIYIARLGIILTEYYVYKARVISPAWG